jgi:hypothetical protein
MVGLTLVLVALFATVSLSAQTASTSVVNGTVSDKTGATVPKAQVALTDKATGLVTTATTGDDGYYIFPALKPGHYKITVSAAGFRQAVVGDVTVDVGKPATVNVTLEVGQTTQVVEVTAGAGVELQTLNPTVGNVLDTNMLDNMPNLTRDATTLVLLQPMTIPGFNSSSSTTVYGEGNTNGGTVAGARMDQNTFMLDGGDASSNMEGGGGYNTGFIANPRAAIPTPVESLEEFRVQTNNQGVDFTRSMGADVQMVTKRGGNAWHGAGYWYHQNDELNANDWFRNRLGPVGSRTCPPPVESCQNPELRDNRAGGKIGGPIWKDRTFFFLHEEERHFSTPAVFQRLVPSAALRVGILKFRVAGTVQAFNLNPTPRIDVAACSSPCNDNDPRIGTMIPTTGRDSVTGAACDVGSSLTCTTPIDPRNLGLSPAIAAEWARMPLGNDFTAGDAALRAPFFTGTTPFLQNEHFVALRLDHKINNKWDANGIFRYSTSSILSPNHQTDIGGIAPGCQLGAPCNLSNRPLQPRYFVAGLTGRLTPNLVNEFNFDWLRHWWSWIAPGAHIPVPGLNTGTNCTIAGTPQLCSDTRLQIWSESRVNAMVPINVDTQQARERVWGGHDYTFIDNLSWIRGKHSWSFGGRVQLQHFLHVRDDKVVGGITTPLYYVARGGQFLDISIPSSTIPRGVRSGDRTAYRRALISALGLVDSATQVLTRAADLTPQPPGTHIIQKENVNAYDLHFGDTWRVTPSVTLSYGLTWGVAMPPTDPTGKTSMMIDANSGQVIDARSYLQAKQRAALNGVPFNPTIGYVPISATGRKYPFDPDYSNFGPRLGAAWNPSFSGGWLSKLFGDKKTVLRGGWSRAFERKNGVGLVLTPALGIGFGDLSVCQAPNTAGACIGASTAATAFRIGVDGNHINIPPLPVVPSGVIIPGVVGAPLPAAAPANANSVFESRDFRLDPKYRAGMSDGFDLTIQRELPGNMIMEVGYVARLSHNLYGNIDLNQIPYMFRPNSARFGALRTNQTYAQAFDAVAGQLQTGNPVTVQPWFEAMLGGPGSAFCTANAPFPGASCTAAAVAFDGGTFWPFHGAGALWNELETNGAFMPAGATTPLTFTFQNTQVGSLDWSGSFTHANYNAGFITLRSRGYHGLTFDLNYTLSQSRDNFGTVQECTGALPDAFDLNRSYAPSLFDRRHVFNLVLGYELPLGKGKRWASSALADKVFGGWTVASVYTVASGLPDMVYDSSACGTEFGATAANGNSQGLIPLSGVVTETRVNNPTLTANGNGSGSAPAGTGVPNVFQNPDSIACVAVVSGCTTPSGAPLVGGRFRYATFADRRLGFGAIRGPRRWNMDLGLAKRTHITERVSTKFDVQFVNVFNHADVLGVNPQASFFSNEPGADISTPGAFGVPSNQFSQPRIIQMGLRVDF